MTATLVVDAQGRMLLSVTGSLEPQMRQEIKAAFNAWRDAQPPELLIVPESEVIRVLDIELEVAG